MLVFLIGLRRHVPARAAWFASTARSIRKEGAAIPSRLFSSGRTNIRTTIKNISKNFVKLFGGIKYSTTFTSSNKTKTTKNKRHDKRN